jgi:hypothetical protein
LYFDLSVASGVSKQLKFWLPELVSSLLHALGKTLYWRTKGLCYFVAGLCHASLLSREDKSELLAGVDKLHVEDVSRILEKVSHHIPSPTQKESKNLR